MGNRRRQRVVTFRGRQAGPQHVGDLDVLVSTEAGKLVHAKLGDCYRNALRCAPFVAGDATFYVEGYGVLHGVPLEHGWLVVDGKVIDPTVAAFTDGVMFDQYVPVLVWSMEDMAAQATEQGVMPLGDWFIGGWESSATLGRKEIGMAWQTAALRAVGYAGTAADFHKEIGL